MDKYDFMKKLEKKLQPLDRDSRREIMLEYELHFQAAVDEGKEEAEIIDRLGDPDAIGQEILDMEETYFNEEHIVELEPAMMNEINIDDITEFDFDGKELSVIVEKGETFDMDYYSRDKRGEFKFYQSGNKFIIKHTKKERSRIGSFFGNRTNKSDKVYITWPNTLKNVGIVTEMGRISLRGIESDVFNVESSMGKVQGENLTGHSIKLVSSMGTTSLVDSKFKDVYLLTQMGTVESIDTEAEEYHLKTQMGKATAKGLNPNSQITVISQMGSVKGEFKDNPVDTVVTAKSNFGATINDFENSHTGTGKYTADFTSQMGSVTVKS